MQYICDIINCNISILNEEELEKANGGDHGDSNKECADTLGGVTPLYSVGQYVEVYNNSLHIRTKRSQIK